MLISIQCLAVVNSINGHRVTVPGGAHVVGRLLSYRQWWSAKYPSPLSQAPKVPNPCAYERDRTINRWPNDSSCGETATFDFHGIGGVRDDRVVGATEHNAARLELADAVIAVSIIHGSITATEFYGSVKFGLQSAKAQESETVSFAHPPELWRTGSSI